MLALFQNLLRSNFRCGRMCSLLLFYTPAEGFPQK